MHKILSADWTRKDVAEENDNLNKSYFLNPNKEYKNYPSFYKIKDALKLILSLDNNNLSLMDIGCGSSWLAVYLKEEGLLDRIKYSGSDLSEHMITNSKINYPTGDFYVYDIISGPTDHKYDIVTEAAVVELVSDWEKAVKNILLSTNKWVILHRLYCTEENETRVEQVETYLNLPDIRIHVSLPELNKILSEHGFSIVNSDIYEKNDSYWMGTFVICKEQ